MNVRLLAPWLLVVVAALAYPLALPATGTTRFPTLAECVHVAKTDGDLEVVFGRFDSLAEATDLLSRVLHVGFKGSQIEPDGCGRFKVAVHGIPTLVVGRQVVAEARSVGLTATIEEIR